MKKKPGPKKKSYEERKHSVASYHTGEVIKAHGGDEKLKRWLEKVAENHTTKRDEKILHWAKQLEHKSLSLHELVENAKWLLDHVC